MAARVVSLADPAGLLVARLGEHARDVMLKGLLDGPVELQVPDPVEYVVHADDHRSLPASLNAALGCPEPVADLVEGLVPAQRLKHVRHYLIELGVHRRA